jgi:hypothetical protein
MVYSKYLHDDIQNLARIADRLATAVMDGAPPRELRRHIAGISVHLDTIREALHDIP